MAKTSESDERRSQPDIKLARRSAPMGWRGNLILWGSFLLILVAFFYFEVSGWWLTCGIVGAVVAGAGGYIAWLVVIRRGAFTWMRLVLTPARLMARGQHEAAEAACVQALARANRFAPDDHRRGMMLCELAMFVKNQGRYQEGLELYEESVRVLGLHAARWPLDHFIALNNYGICFISLRDFAAAQRILEKAMDLTLTAQKRETNAFASMSLEHVQTLQCVMHMNLAVLFMEMREIGEANLQLREADAIVPLLSKRTKASWHDHYVAVCALWEFEAGKFAAAQSEIEEVRNQEYPTCLRVRAKLHMARQEFAEAEALLRRYQAAERKKGTLHLPEQFKPTLEFAEALFGQGTNEDAFAAVREARSIAIDFGIAGGQTWRQTLERWAKRARALGKMEVAAELEEELRKLPVVSEQAITILEKFRVHPGS